MHPYTYEQKRVLFLSSLGGALEYYDFVIFILLTPIIEKVFFSNNSNYIATLKTLAIFSVGYLIRPLGGFLFSHLGDRHGRKKIFLLTIIGMALPSFAIGLLPTPLQIGSLAPVLLLIFRICQGLALGGELPAAITYIAEHTPPSRKGFSIATLFFGINFGLLLGSLASALLTYLLSPEQLAVFGWRIAFLIGGILGIIAFYLRRYLHETDAFRLLASSNIQKIPLKTTLLYFRPEIILGILLVSLGAVSVFLFLYWPHYLFNYLHYDYDLLIRINLLGTIVLSATILLGGWLSDRLGFRKVYRLSAFSLFILSYPLFYIFQLNNIYYVLISYILFSICFGLIPAAYCSLLSNLFPTYIRYTGIAFSYNVAYALIGGLSPVICTCLIHYSNNVLAPAYYVIFASFVTLLALRYAGKKYPQLV